MPATYSHTKYGRLSINGVEMNAYLTDGSLKQERKVEEIEVWQEDAIQLVGSVKRELDLKGPMHPTAHAELQARLNDGAVVPFSFRPQGDDSGYNPLAGNGYISEYSPDLGGGKAAMWSAKLVVSDSFTS
ncbi:MAG TPA: hypothetical protein VGW38_07540 [Chloroflexota bacterium]|nr:hypothetical protein [Chloroflexota bacterium]